MIDYLTHMAAFEATVSALDANGGAPHQAEWNATRATINNEPGSAYLGALLGHLLERSGPVAYEHQRLEEAAALYAEAVKALNTTRGLREQWNQMVRAPGSASLDGFTAFLSEMEQLKAGLEDLNSRFDAYRTTVQPPFKHVIAHAAAFDHPVAAWDWRDVTTSRRTNALVRALRVTGNGSAATKAFAFGALTGYSGNALASSYLAHSVGGPRRSHPVRDRVARYSLGAWLRAYESRNTMSLGDLRNKLAMPAAVKQQILGALGTTYPAGAPATMPNLDTGFQRLLRHLELLESFPRPPLPEDIPDDLLLRVHASPKASNTLNDPEDWGQPDPGNNLPDPSQAGSLNACGIIILIIGVTLWLLLLLYQWKWATGKWPWEIFSDDPPPGSSAQALDDFLRAEDALQLVVGMSHLENLLHEAAVTGLRYLKQTGFLYPDQLDLYEPTFGQFTKIPPGVSATNYPRRPLADPSTGYLKYPTSAMENPGRTPSPYPAGATPSELLHGLPALGARGAGAWHELFTPPNGETANLDLDADRGFDHRCWRVAPGGSVLNNPVPVQQLGYSDVI